MRRFFLLMALFSISAFAAEADLSGNIEGQFRHAKNNEKAEEAPLFQDWKNENFYLMYGNLTGKLEWAESRIEANWFGRYTRSELYQPGPTIFGERDPYLATSIFTFPQKLVARDVFKLQDVKQSGDHKTESILNKFYYEWDTDEYRFMVGRIYINYGQGEIFNPINPFNQPTALTSTSQVAQGNDGFSLTFFMSDIHSLQFLLLGDKSIEGYDGPINRTLWIHGEYQSSDKLVFNYVVGEDQNRQKVGGQTSYQFEEAMVFGQILYQSENVKKNEPSDHLWDVLLGLDQQLNNKWHLRFEGGYQKTNRFVSPEAFDRFLPTEYFVALANTYEAHPLLKLTGTVINDVKSGFTYLIAKGTYSMGSHSELEIFGYIPAAKGDEAENLAQRLVTTDLGLTLRAFF